MKNTFLEPLSTWVAFNLMVAVFSQKVQTLLSFSTSPGSWMTFLLATHCPANTCLTSLINLFLVAWKAKLCYSHTFIFSFVSHSNCCAIFRNGESGESLTVKRIKVKLLWIFKSRLLDIKNWSRVNYSLVANSRWSSLPIRLRSLIGRRLLLVRSGIGLFVL